LFWISKYSNYGVDFTDEGYYLTWISNPFFYNASATQFGFIYHPIYMLVDGNIAAIRKIDFMITFGLAWYLTYTFLNTIIPIAKKNLFIFHIIATGLATSVFLYYNIPTPNYNSLALQALMLVCAGLFSLDDKIYTKNIGSSFLIGLGGWLSFMAKPSTALLVGISVFIYLILTRKYSIKIILLSIAVVIILFLLSALLIDGSVLDFIKRIQMGIEFRKILGASHTLEKIFRIDLPELNNNNIIATSIVFGFLIFSFWLNFYKNNLRLILSTILSLIIFGLVIIITNNEYNLKLGNFHNLQIFGITFAVLFSNLIIGKVYTVEKFNKCNWELTLLLIFMPFFFSFGSNSNYWVHGSQASIFWILAGMSFSTAIFKNHMGILVLVPLVLVAQLTTLIHLNKKFENPYRQPHHLKINDSKVKINNSGATLILSSGYASYIKDARKVAIDSGFQNSTPVIDLTGQSPGLLYLLGAKNLGLAWISGDYPGSLEHAKASFNLVSCKKIANAWALFEINGPRSISNELMLSLGTHFPKEYQLMGFWETARGSGGYDSVRVQKFYKPKNPTKTLNNCQKLRYERINNK